MKYVLITILSFSNLVTFAMDSSLKRRLKNFRDPFKRNIKSISSKKVKASQKTYFTNKTDPSQISIEDIKVSGVFLGENRRAIGVSRKDNKIQPFVIKEGMLIGPEKIKVEAILPGGIVYHDCIWYDY